MIPKTLAVLLAIILLSACGENPLARTATPVPTDTPVPVVAVTATPAARPAPVTPQPAAPPAPALPLPGGGAATAPAPKPSVPDLRNQPVQPPSVPNTVSAIPDGTMVPAGTLVVMRLADFGKKTVNVSAGTLPQQTTFGVNGDVHTDGWWGYGSLAAAVEGACKELVELRSHISRQGDTWYQFVVSTTANCASPAQQPIVVPPSGGTTTGTGLYRTPNEGITAPFVPPSSQPDPITARWKHITDATDDGVSNVWGGIPLDLTKLADLKDGEMYVAHGDLKGNGGCQVWWWSKGSKPTRPQVSAATWQLYHVQGASPEALKDAVAVKQIIASKRDIPTCPAEQKG